MADDYTMALNTLAWERLKYSMSPMCYGFTQFEVEGEAKIEGAELTHVATPENILSHKTFEGLRKCHAEIIRYLKETTHDKGEASTDQEKSRYGIRLVGNVATGKVICLIYMLLASCAYYQSKSVAKPKWKPSELLDQNVYNDLTTWFGQVQLMIILPRAEFRDTQEPMRIQLFGVVRLLFDLLDGWLQCDEAHKLRDLYETFQTATDDNGAALTALLAQFTKVAHVFAAHEPKWEVDRLKGGRKRIETIENMDYFVQHGCDKPGPKGGKRSEIPVEYAAKRFHCSVRTIANWEKRIRDNRRTAHTPPPEYPGLNVTKTEFDKCADAFECRLGYVQ